MMIELKRCLLDPIPEIRKAADDLRKAALAHREGKNGEAVDLIRATNLESIRSWTEALWGKQSKCVNVRKVPGAPLTLSKGERLGHRMPTAGEQRMLLERDGYHCRFCGIPLIPRDVRVRVRKLYPDALPWGKRNPEQHAAFQAMWVQFDHVVPFTRGGATGLSNLVVTCAPCNFARMEYTLEEVGLADPRNRDPVTSDWNGLVDFR